MMQLPKFLYCENKSALPGAGLILCTAPPFYYGQIIKGLSLAQMIAHAQNHSAIAASKLHDYQIGIIIPAALSGCVYVADMQQYAQDCATLAREMADFYLVEKIQPNLRYYDRYKEKI